MKKAEIVIAAALIAMVILIAVSRRKVKITEPLVQEVTPYFDSSNWDRISKIPIYKVGGVRTAMSMTVREVDKSEVCVEVNPGWEDISVDFRCVLLSHEFLHILAAEKGVDFGQFSALVKAWHEDESSGAPDPSSNYTKYILYWEVYGGNGYPCDPKFREVEEYAYIGGKLIEQRGYEVPPEIKAYYGGILRADLLS